MRFFKLPRILKQDTYIERVLDGLNFTEYPDKERYKLRELRITLYYKKRRLDWYGFFVFLGMFILAFAKNLMEGYNFENGVIFGFTMFGLIITIIPLLRNVENYIDKFDNDLLFDEKKIFEKYTLTHPIETEPKENDNNG